MKALLRALVTGLLFVITVGTAQAETVTVNGSVPSMVDALTSSFTAVPSVIPPDGFATSNLAVVARDSNNNPLADKYVSLSSNRGTLDSISCPGGGSTGLTDGNGRLLCLVSSFFPGKSTFTALVDSITLSNKPILTFAYTFGVDPNKSSFTASPTTVPADGTTESTLTIVIRDQNENPLPNKAVSVASDRANIDLLTCNSAKTNSNGQLMCTVSSYTSGDSTFEARTGSTIITDKPTITFTAVGGTGGGGDGGGTTEQPPAEESPSTPPSVIQKIAKALESLPPSVPGAVGLTAIIPTAFVLIPMGTSVSIGLMSGLPALQYILFSLIPAFRPARKWGIVRDAATKVPIPGIFVGLFDLATGQEIKRIMTDRTGRFGFLTPPHGQYWVEIQNPLYQPFRSQIIDAQQSGDDTISFDIDLQAIESLRLASLKKSSRFITVVAVANISQVVIIIGGSLLTIVLFAKEQTVETWLLVALYSMLWVLRGVSTLNRRRQFGLVQDKKVIAGLPNAVVQVTSVQNGQQSFVHSTITDNEGRFIVLVPPGRHAIIAAKDGYIPEEKQIVGEAEDVTLGLSSVQDESPQELSPPLQFSEQQI